ncbi:hypothetical protein Taro_043607, partial [Colocasia esculenta]|nr:hypothetical protein [Colocasia esculenta]
MDDIGSHHEGELDEVEARDPELRVSEDPPLLSQPVTSTARERPRHSTILPETSRVPTTQPALRRAATQKERSSTAIEQEKNIYTRQKKRRAQQLIRSDDTTQDPNDDDDDDDGAATGAIGACQRDARYTEPGFSLEIEHQGGGGEGQSHGQGGYERQQRHAAYEWPPWEPSYSSGSTHIPAFQPLILSYLDISSSPLEYKKNGDIDLYKNKSIVKQQAHTNAWHMVSNSITIWRKLKSKFTPRGIQMGMHDLVNFLFGYGYQNLDDG